MHCFGWLVLAGFTLCVRCKTQCTARQQEMDRTSCEGSRRCTSEGRRGAASPAWWALLTSLRDLGSGGRGGGSTVCAAAASSPGPPWPPFLSSILSTTELRVRCAAWGLRPLRARFALLRHDMRSVLRLCKIHWSCKSSPAVGRSWGSCKK
jgi:hypothetical protein